MLKKWNKVEDSIVFLRLHRAFLFYTYTSVDYCQLVADTNRWFNFNNLFFLPTLLSDGFFQTVAGFGAVTRWR